MVIELRGREKGGAESDSSDKKEKLNEVSEKTEGERERERERERQREYKTDNTGRETKAFQRKGVS